MKFIGTEASNRKTDAKFGFSGSRNILKLYSWENNFFLNFDQKMGLPNGENVDTRQINRYKSENRCQISAAEDTSAVVSFFLLLYTIPRRQDIKC